MPDKRFDTTPKGSTNVRAHSRRTERGLTWVREHRRSLQEALNWKVRQMNRDPTVGGIGSIVDYPDIDDFYIEEAADVDLLHMRIKYEHNLDRPVADEVFKEMVEEAVREEFGPDDTEMDWSITDSHASFDVTVYLEQYSPADGTYMSPR
jgi:uncharacterized protein YdhG (YjbR/CyaY superfamily)